MTSSLPCRAVSVGVALIALIAALSPASARAGDLYRWVDASGRVVHGTEPPLGARELERLAPAAERNPALDSARRRVKQADRVRSEAARERNSPIGGRSRTEWLRTARRYESRVESARRALEREREHGLPTVYSARQKERHERRLAKKEQALERAEQELDAFRDRARRHRVPRGWYSL